MGLFVLERDLKDELEPAELDNERTAAVNEEIGVTWLISFLSADQRRILCLYESPSAEALREAASRSGVPADAVVAVSTLGPRAGLFPSSPKPESARCDSAERNRHD